MDYKYIILIILLLAILFVFFKEMQEMRKHMEEQYKSNLFLMDLRFKSICDKVQKESSNITNKIVKENNECITKCRKMNEYGDMGITNISINRFTEDFSNESPPVCNENKSEKIEENNNLENEEIFLNDLQVGDVVTIDTLQSIGKYSKSDLVVLANKYKIELNEKMKKKEIYNLISNYIQNIK